MSTQPNSMFLAPIAIFCYRRVDVLKLCIDSLKKCKEATSSDLIIISDAPGKDTDKEKVCEVRDYLDTVSGFKSIEIIKRIANLGVDYNIIQGLKELSERFERFIIIEDDIVVAPDFLNYINSALEFYKDNPQVLSISGFSFVDKVPKDYIYDVYPAARTSAWGWASWSAKIKDVNWSMDDGEKEQFLSSKKIQKQFNEWGSDRSKMLRDTLECKIRAWDIRLDYYQFKKGAYTIYPTQTLTKNIGFGRGDASNTVGYNRYKTEVRETLKTSYAFPETIVLNDYLTRMFKRKNSIQQRIYSRLMGIIK